MRGARFQVAARCVDDGYIKGHTHAREQASGIPSACQLIPGWDAKSQALQVDYAFARFSFPAAASNRTSRGEIEKLYEILKDGESNPNRQLIEGEFE